MACAWVIKKKILFRVIPAKAVDPAARIGIEPSIDTENRLRIRKSVNGKNRPRFFTVCTVLLLMAGFASRAFAVPPPDTELIDTCDYPDTRSAQSAWTPMQGTAPVEAATLDGQKVLRMPCNFSGTKIVRASWDLKTDLDLAAFQGIQFQMLCRDATPAREFTVYFESGEGWYRGEFFPESSTGWSTITIDKSRTTTEGKPAGWGKIRIIRISAWRDGDSSTEFFLRDIKKTGALNADTDVIIIRNDSAGPEEQPSVEQYSEAVAKTLREAGVGCAMLGDQDVTAERLKSSRVVVLPYNPKMPDRVADELVKYSANGGKLLAFYLVPDRLLPLFHVRDGGHVKPVKPGSFSQIQFADKALPGAPGVVGQRSWNIHAFRPVSGASKSLAEWLDDKGGRSGYDAVIGSSNGIVMTHVLLPDDPENKRRMLMAMIGFLAPEIWKRAAEVGIAGIGTGAGYRSFDEAVGKISRGNNGGKPPVSDALASAHALRSSALKSVDQKLYGEAMDQAKAADRKIVEAFALAQSPVAGEFRAFWCHSAFGVTGLEWDEAVRRLAANGFTAILPNMSWGGLAYYDSKVLPVAPQIAERGDQIAKCLAAGKKHGVEVHVWKVNWNLGWEAPKAFVEKMRREHRLQTGLAGEEKPWLCPSNPENRKLEIDSMVEIARNYDVAGIHFDYIRYPDANQCYCSGCKERFEQAVGEKIPDLPKAVADGGPLRQKWLDWRRGNITAVVKGVSEQVRVIKPKLKISAAVFNNWVSARDQEGQDWKLWCEKGYVDFVCPMDYTPNDGRFENMIRKQVQWADKTPCYPGIGVSVWRGGVNRVVEQVTITRRCKTGGFVIFEYGVQESKELLPLLGLGITKKP